MYQAVQVNDYESAIPPQASILQLLFEFEIYKLVVIARHVPWMGFAIISCPLRCSAFRAFGVLSSYFGPDKALQKNCAVFQSYLTYIVCQR